MAAVTGRFTRSDRLRASRDYQRVAAQGHRAASHEFVVLVAPAGPVATATARLGITVSRKVGNAVVRNRVKRAVREWFRAFRSQIDGGTEGLDVVVIARRAAAELDSSRVAERLSSLLSRRPREPRPA
jgi:ribonuclease P protein component